MNGVSQYGSLTRAVASEDGTSVVVSVKPDEYYSSAQVSTDEMVLSIGGDVTRFAAKIKLNRIPKGDTGILVLKANKSGIPGDIAAVCFELAIKNGRVLLRNQEYSAVYKDQEEYLLWSGADEHVLSEEFGFVFTVHRREDMYRFEVELTSNHPAVGMVASRGWQAMNVASYKGMTFSFGAGAWMDNLPGLEGWADDNLEAIEVTFTEIAVNQGTREEIDALAHPLVFALSDASESENNAQSASQSVTEQPQRASKASRKAKQ